MSPSSLHSFIIHNTSTLQQACQIAACLNSGPISALSCNDEVVVALTPGHFLIGTALTSPPEPFLDTNETISVCSRWKLLNFMRNHFWKRWSQEYLSQTQHRVKWLLPRRNLEVGEIVLIKNELQSPSKWLMGRVTKTYLGSDNLCRVAKVQSATKVYKRPVSKLIRLPVEQNEGMRQRSPESAMAVHHGFERTMIQLPNITGLWRLRRL